jgi:transcriptional regulator with XRE-family HTH domain
MRITMKAARVNKGFTQREAAKRLKISKETLANWENGKSFPNAANISNLEDVYDLRYDEIIFLPCNND